MCKASEVAIYERKIKKVIITAEEIQQEIQKAAKFINDSYDGKPILLVSILKGSFVLWRIFAVRLPFLAKWVLCAPRAITAVLRRRA